MDIIITIQHAANVHFFKHVICELEAVGHDVHVFAREKGVTTRLLDAYRIEYELLCGEPDGWFGLGLTQVRYEYRLLQRAREIEPAVIVSSHGIAATHVATLVGARSHVYIDTETAINGGNRLTTPFADTIYTPESFREGYSGDHVTYPGFHELAYLHPSRFEPNESILRRHGVDPDDRYAVLRFGAWKGNHDVGKNGISPECRQEITDMLAANGDVYVSVEGDDEVPMGGEPLPVPPESFHHLLAFADIVVGEVATTTLEAGVLGTPTVRISPFAGQNEMGKFRELEDRGLVRSFRTSREAEALEVIERIDRDPTATATWADRRETLLSETTDVTAYVISQLHERGVSTTDRLTPQTSEATRDERNDSIPN
ncbi:DUF354 domain-containing protein [Natronorubrum daqingense]|uniref:DUF354 domain-containing protein n=1 Tax=Natronorubrum daqingense TaxID=588898 RepID=A0A1N7ECS8_9EURY|nr:DUF354 domain-containing protein [Natronorubrum daqingense]APX96489.1 hypothetical protein BB347_07595 [Natronorubrum daqingense]SIR85819.1 hypothetical protein SAMN05421809_2611 [Natronorubrum daqingense]